MLVVCCTCNCFDSSWIRKQWVVIDKLWEKECNDAVGPIIGHTSDGECRRWQLILKDYKCKEGTQFVVDWPGWFLTAHIADGTKVSGLHNQDYIHNGKKPVNPLDSVARTLMLGGDLCSINHLGMVYNTFSYAQHGLLQANVDH